MSEMPTFQELRDNDLQALKWIASGHSQFGQVAQLQQACSRYAHTDTWAGQRQFDYRLDFSMNVYERANSFRAKEKRFYVGGLLVKDPEEDSLSRYSYDVVVCGGSSASDGIEQKMHFDFDGAIAGSQEPKPASHLQFCGRLQAAQLEAGYQQSDIEGMLPKVDKPRIPSTPVSLAIVLQWLFLEYVSHPSSLGLHADPHWQKQVRGAERLVVLPHLQKAIEALELSQQARKACWTSDFSYTFP